MKRGFLTFKENVSLAPADGRKILVNFTKGQKIPATRRPENGGIAGGFLYSYSFRYNGMPFVIMYGLNGVVFEEEYYGEILPVPYYVPHPRRQECLTKAGLPSWFDDDPRLAVPQVVLDPEKKKAYFSCRDANKNTLPEMKYTIKFIDNAALAPADGRKMLVTFVKGESFPAKKIAETGGIAVFGFERDGVPFSITPETMQNTVLLIPESQYTIQPAPTPGEVPSDMESLPFGLTPASALLVAGLALVSFYIIFKKNG
jgi:hypothetical protein